MSNFFTLICIVLVPYCQICIKMRPSAVLRLGQATGPPADCTGSVAPDTHHTRPHPQPRKEQGSFPAQGHGVTRGHNGDTGQVPASLGQNPVSLGSRGRGASVTPARPRRRGRGDTRPNSTCTCHPQMHLLSKPALSGRRSLVSARALRGPPWVLPPGARAAAGRPAAP